MPLGVRFVCLLGAAMVGAADATIQNSPPFIAGEICHGLDSSAKAQYMLRGKHMVIAEVPWTPFASPDQMAPTGWTGLNIDLYERISVLLNFTYEIQDMGLPAEGETWTELLDAIVGHVDLVGSWWMHDEHRMNTAQWLMGHVDLAIVLVTRMEATADSHRSWYVSLYSFMGPFEGSLWAAIVAMILLSGLVDYLVERVQVKETTLAGSLYEYCAGFLWGGFHYPLTKVAAVYQVPTLIHTRPRPRSHPRPENSSQPRCCLSFSLWLAHQSQPQPAFQLLPAAASLTLPPQPH